MVSMVLLLCAPLVSGHVCSSHFSPWLKIVSYFFQAFTFLFSEHDDDNYKSEEDPDFVAPDNIDNDVSDAASSADDESSDAEEKMQE